MRALTLIAATLLLAGCSIGGEEGGTIDAAELEKLVLQPPDVPRAFFRFDEGPQGVAEQPQARRDPSRFGREGGWKARYRRAGTAQTAGPLVIVSLVDGFEAGSGAEDEFDALREDFREGGLGWRPVDAPQLGDESFAIALLQATGVNEVAHFRITWRDDDTVASVETNGFAGKTSLEDALALARKQADRIADVAES
jgi:hypothetical protein